jgi:hypothetical protein
VLGIISLTNGLKYNKKVKQELKLEQKKSDSLNKVVETVHINNINLEKMYLNKIDSIKSLYEKKLYNIKVSYIKEAQIINNLPTTGQVDVLKENIGVIDSLPAIQDQNGKVVILLNEQHPKIINLAYLKIKELDETNKSQYGQILSLNNLIDQSKQVINSKNIEIKASADLNNQNKVIISKQNEAILEQRKTYRKKVITTSVVTGACGVIVGILLTIL